MNPQFQHPAMLWLLTLAPLLPALAWLRRRAFGNADPEMAAWIDRYRPNGLAFWLPQWLAAAAICFLVLALARPGWRSAPVPASQLRRDVVFVLDVSNSMLAADRTPNRLADARASIRETVEALPEADRVALVLFAGSSTIACPLTANRRWFFDRLEAAAPDSVARGGTLVADALTKVTDHVLEPDHDGFHDVILLTDGGDQGSAPVEAVARLNERSAGLVAVGLGNALDGPRIPNPYADSANAGPFLEHEGVEVRVPMEPEILKSMVDASERGLWINATDQPYDLANLYQGFLRQAPRLEVELPDVVRRRDEFQALLLLAVCSLLASTWFRRRKNSPRFLRNKASGKESSPRPRPEALATALAIALLLPGAAGESPDRHPSGRESAEPPDLRARWQKGHELWAADRPVEALECWRNALDKVPNTRIEQLRHARLLHNVGVALVRQANDIVGDASGAPARRRELMEQAAGHFLTAARLDPTDRKTSNALLWAGRRIDQITRAERRSSENDPEEGEERDPGDEPGEETETEPGEESENGGEQPDAENGELDPGAQGSPVTDLDNRNLAPPAVSPEDILREHQDLDQEREANRQPSTGVEQDW